MKCVRIATRRSALALAQAGQVAQAIERALGCKTELVGITTTGDRVQDTPLARIGGKGLFVKEIEAALLEGAADLAVHSAKDLPAQLPEALVLAAFPERADPRDALVGCSLKDLPAGGRVGTGSVRRASQLLALRPDLEIVPLRGNVDTRLRKRTELALDAVVLACAGLERLGRAEVITERVPPEALLPAVGQGTLALQVRADDSLAAALGALDDPTTRACIAAERAFLSALGGDCSVPLGAHAECQGATLRLRALLARLDGSQLLRSDRSGPRGEAGAIGRAAAQEILAAGGEALLRDLPGPDPAEASAR
jgi:hydroxymethylbilane synthase